MNILTENINSDITIDLDTTLNSDIVGNVNVCNSAIFIVNGTIIGNITIEPNSRAILYGTINGNIHNFGICEVYGTIYGELSDTNQSIFIDTFAKINK